MGLYDLEEYDHLYVTVRRDKLEALEFCYEQFGWEEVERQEHTVYENLLDMTFRRPHKIADKDELQLLQVHLEEALNAVGKYEKAPKKRTKAFAACLGILAFLLIAIGLPLGIVPVTIAYKVIGYVMAAAGVIIVPLLCVFSVKLWKYENAMYERRLKISRDLVIAVCHSAMEVRARGGEVLKEVVEPAREVVAKIAKKAETPEEEEKLIAKVIDVSVSQVVREAIAKRNAYAAEHEEAEAASAGAESLSAEGSIPAESDNTSEYNAPAEGTAPAEANDTATTPVPAEDSAPVPDAASAEDMDAEAADAPAENTDTQTEDNEKANDIEAEAEPEGSVTIPAKEAEDE